MASISRQWVPVRTSGTYPEMVRAVVVAGLVSLVLVAPAGAHPPAVKVPTGRLVVLIDDGCLVRVVSGSYKVNVPARGVVPLPAGKYRLKVRPSTCSSTKKTLKIRKGKTTRAKVINSAMPT
jgi:hypothetical protein